MVYVKNKIKRNLVSCKFWCDNYEEIACYPIWWRSNLIANETRAIQHTNGMNEMNGRQCVCDRFTLACAAATVANFCCPDSATIQWPVSPDCWPNSRAWCPAIWDRWNFVGADPVCAAVALRFHQSHRLRRWHRCRSPWIRRNFVVMPRSHPPVHKSLSFGISWCIFGGNSSSTRDTEHHPLAKFFGHRNHIG